MKRCPFCGNEITDDNLYVCPSCGEESCTDCAGRCGCELEEETKMDKRAQIAKQLLAKGETELAREVLALEEGGPSPAPTMSAQEAQQKFEDVGNDIRNAIHVLRELFYNKTWRGGISPEEMQGIRKVFAQLHDADAALAELL